MIAPLFSAKMLMRSLPGFPNWRVLEIACSRPSRECLARRVQDGERWSRGLSWPAADPHRPRRHSENRVCCCRACRRLPFGSGRNVWPRYLELERIRERFKKLDATSASRCFSVAVIWRLAFPDDEAARQMSLSFLTKRGNFLTKRSNPLVRSCLTIRAC